MQTCRGDTLLMESAANVAAVIIVHIQGIHNMSGLTIVQGESSADWCAVTLCSLTIRCMRQYGSSCLFEILISADSGCNSRALSLFVQLRILLMRPEILHSAAILKLRERD